MDEQPSIAPIVGPDDPRRFTDSGIEVRPVYGEVDLPVDLAERLGEPAEFPYTRGVHGEMYRKQLWTIRQYAGYASAKESNQRPSSQTCGSRSSPRSNSWIAGVYEIPEDAPAEGDVDVIVNYTNCVQCGAITAKGGRLTVPEGGDGPLYTIA
jgi:hypothetical protein